MLLALIHFRWSCFHWVEAGTVHANIVPGPKSF